MLKHCTIESNYRHSLSSLRGEGGGGRSLKSECSSHLSHTRERERGVFGFRTEADAYIKIRGEGVVVFKDGTLETNVSIF